MAERNNAYIFTRNKNTYIKISREKDKPEEYRVRFNNTGCFDRLMAARPMMATVFHQKYVKSEVDFSCDVII